MVRRKLQTFILFFARLRFYLSRRNIVNFTRALQRARYVVVIMPRNEAQFLTARQILNNLPRRLNTTVITLSKYKEHFRNTGFKLILVETEDISALELPRGTLVKKLSIYRYDVAIDMSFGFDIFTAWLCNKINADVKLGFAGRNSDLFYNFQLAVKPDTDIKRAYSGIINCLTLFL